MKKEALAKDLSWPKEETYSPKAVSMRDILEAAAKVMNPQEVLSNHRSPQGQSWVILKSFPGCCCECPIGHGGDSVSLLVAARSFSLIRQMCGGP